MLWKVLGIAHTCTKNDTKNHGVQCVKVYSYVVRYDDGSAPNPFWDYCTLAICKPAIRRVAQPGSWIVGTGSKENVGNNRLIYAMKVTQALPLEEYGKDHRFTCKIPNNEDSIKKLGDNLYYKDCQGEIRQRFPSVHSYKNAENPRTKSKDLRGKNARISSSGSYWYFGSNAPNIPNNLASIVKKGQGHKCNSKPPVIEDFLEWINSMKPGIHGNPCGNFMCNTRQERKCQNAKSC